MIYSDISNRVSSKQFSNSEPTTSLFFTNDLESPAITHPISISNFLKWNT